MNRVVITGPTGAIGIALIEKLIEKKIKVYAVCRPGSTRIGRIPQSHYVNVVECDISQLKKLPEKIKDKCDVFYHFAWSGTVGAARNDMYLQNQNIQYTLDAVEAANDIGCTTFIGAGSQAEYGRVEGILKPTTPVNPENGYGMAKLCAGLMSRAVCSRYEIRHIWTRILSVYGPYDGENTMIMSAIRGLVNGDRPAFTKGEQMWDYLFSKDAANIMYLLAEKGLNGKVYCLGSGTAKPLAEYIEILRKCVAPDGKVELGKIPYSEKQVMYLCADTTDLESDLHYQCKYSFEEGINLTFEWWKREHGK
ncbi:MAG TPA: NAD(P)-dependent oxidoreductase [Candidatus Mediterraneibacter excrementigallinarum]|nr:NAD(P)-dependent oxidoreductase [Candidatus Mediterraneibacter excrementigallinarum]